MSANRKYTQLTVEDVELIHEIFYAALRREVDKRYETPQDTRMNNALVELIERARAARPGSSICLAYAVKRGVK